MAYFAYLLECADGTYYAGITTDTARRLAEHNATERGAKYTKSRRPVRLAYVEECADRSAALKREYALRQLSRPEKRELAASYSDRPGV